MTRCPNCGTTLPAPDLRLTPSLALRLGLFGFGLICWGIILINAIQSSGLHGAPLYGTPPPTGLLANPIAQIAVMVGAGIAFGMAMWEAVHALRGERKQCAACGHTW
jgi:hypothetical protein